MDESFLLAQDSFVLFFDLGSDGDIIVDLYFLRLLQKGL